MRNILESNIQDIVDQLQAAHPTATEAEKDVISEWASRALTEAALIELVLAGKLRITIEGQVPRFDEPREPKESP